MGYGPKLNKVIEKSEEAKAAISETIKEVEPILEISLIPRM